MPVNIPYASQHEVGTSFANPIDALFIREFLVYMYRHAPIVNAGDFLQNISPPRVGTVLTITGYSAQNNELQGCLRELTAAEVLLDKISVRTIDDSPSHEADVVIIGLVRSDQGGFLNHQIRLAVMMTRSRLATIIIGRKKVSRPHSKLNSLLEYMDNL